MSGPRMTLRTALPGLAAGTAGLAVGFVGLALGQPALAAVAGVLALVAGLANLVLARQMEDQMTLHAIVETDLQTNRLIAERAVELKAAELGRAALAEQAKAADLSSDGVTPTTTATGSVGGGIDGASGPPGGAAITGPSASADGPGGADEALVDKVTGLFSETFFRVALESRIAAARRHLRPVSVVLLEVVEGLPAGGPRPVEADMVSNVIKATLREADTACRLRSGYFALLLEDTPENGAIWTVERMRRALAEMRQGLTVWAGVACYPAHAFNPDEILSASEGALVSAREWRQDRIEVAVAAD